MTGEGASSRTRPPAVSDWPQSPATAVAKVLRVPDRYRRFTVHKSSVAQLYGISEESLDQLLSLGLPCRGSRFDRLDLDNIGLALRLPCTRNKAMRWWSRSLIQSRVRPLADTVRIQARCPLPGHPGDCNFALAAELADALIAREEQGPSAVWFKIRISLTASTWVFGSPFSDLFKRVLPLEFHLLPPPLAEDLGFLASTGLAECRLATVFLVSEAAELGLPVRAARGIFVANPYPVEHSWIECRVDDGRWVAADPFLLNAFLRWGIIGGPEWTTNCSSQSVMWQTGAPDGGLVTHRGHPAPYLLTVGLFPEQLRKAPGGQAPGKTSATNSRIDCRRNMSSGEISIPNSSAMRLASSMMVMESAPRLPR
jgi:hypothetical protein